MMATITTTKHVCDWCGDEVVGQNQFGGIVNFKRNGTMFSATESWEAEICPGCTRRLDCLATPPCAGGNQRTPEDAG